MQSDNSQLYSSDISSRIESLLIQIPQYRDSRPNIETIIGYYRDGNIAPTSPFDLVYALDGHVKRGNLDQLVEDWSNSPERPWVEVRTNPSDNQP